MGFHIEQKKKKISSINRTIRIDPDLFDWLEETAEKNGISFNNLVNQCIKYSRDNFEESKTK